MQKFYSKPEVTELTGRSFVTIWRWMRQRKFPQALDMLGKTVWIAQEVDEWADALPRRQYLTEPETADEQRNGKAVRRKLSAVRCGRRCAKLYALGEFLCRDCHRLHYQSQREDFSMRLARRSDAIRQRLDGFVIAGGLISTRPKGMHRMTYNALVDEYRNLQAAISEEMAAKFGDSEFA